MRLVSCLFSQYDTKNRRAFLKRCTSSVKLGDLFVGNTVNVFNRQLRFTDYADNYTRSKLSAQKERCRFTVHSLSFFCDFPPYKTQSC